MTEMQGAVGLAQLKKINKILDLKRKNRKIIYDILNKNKSIKFRTIHDKSSKGDQNDHIIFFLKNPKIAKKVKKELDKKKNFYRNITCRYKMALRRILETYMERR